MKTSELIFITISFFLFFFISSKNIGLAIVGTAMFWIPLIIRLLEN